MAGRVSRLSMKRKIYLLAACCILALQASGQDDALLASGKVLDATTRKGVASSIFYSSLPTGSISGRFTDSTYSFPIFGEVKYKITAEAEGYNSRTVILDPGTVDADKKVIRNILLTPAGEAIRLTSLTFDQGKAHIDPKSFSELDGVVQMMRDNTRMIIQLEGHTDNQGNPEANLKLSQTRVDAVRKYLVNKGVPKGRVKTKAFGGTQLLNSAPTPEARDSNRRVEMRILRNQ